MILNRPPKNGDTVSIKLSTGDEIIATMQEDNESTVRVSRPMILAPTPQGMRFIPFMFTVDPERYIELRKQDIMVLSETHSEMASEYIRTTTGIQV